MEEALKEARTNAARGNNGECVSKGLEAKKYGAGASADIVLGQCYQKMGNSGAAIQSYNAWLKANASGKLADSVRQKIIGLGGTPAN